MSEQTICEYEKGLLFKKTCENPVVGKCIDCKKGFCDKHCVTTPYGIACLDHAPKEDFVNEDQDESWREDPYYEDFDDVSMISASDSDDRDWDDDDDMKGAIGIIYTEDQMDDDDDDDFDSTDDDHDFDDFS